MNKNYLIIAIVAAVVLIPILVVLSVSFSGDDVNETLSLFDADYQNPVSDTSSDDNRYQPDSQQYDQITYSVDNTSDYQTEPYSYSPGYPDPQRNTTPDPALQTKALIDLFTIITPNSSEQCSSANPWASGFKPLDTSRILSDNSCFAFRLSSFKPAQIFLLSHSENGKLVKIFPNNCNGIGTRNSKLAQGTPIILPQDELGQYFVLAVDDELGTEWFYSIAVSNDSSRQNLERLLQDIPDICATEASYHSDVVQFQAQLDILQTQNRDHFHWRLQDIRH